MFIFFLILILSSSIFSMNNGFNRANKRQKTSHDDKKEIELVEKSEISPDVLEVITSLNFDTDEDDELKFRDINSIYFINLFSSEYSLEELEKIKKANFFCHIPNLFIRDIGKNKKFIIIPKAIKSKTGVVIPELTDLSSNK